MFLSKGKKVVLSTGINPAKDILNNNLNEKRRKKVPTKGNQTEKMAMGTCIVTDKAGINGLDLKKVVGMVSTDQEFLTVVALNEQIPLRDKVKIAIPNVFGRNDRKDRKRAITIIKSIQLKDNQQGVTIVFAEISGPLSPKIFSLIGSLAGHMKEKGLINAFFPAYTTVVPFGFFFGSMMVNGKVDCWNTIHDPEVRNVRTLKGSAMLFSVSNTLFSMPFMSMEKKDWRAVAKAIYTYEDRIKFIGRAKEGLIPITLESGKTYLAKVNYSAPLLGGPFKATNSAGIREVVSSLVGHIDTGIIAAVSHAGEHLLLIPAAN